MRLVLGLELQGTRLGWAILIDDRLQRAGVFLDLGVRAVPGKRAGTTRRETFKGIAMSDLRQHVADLLGNLGPHVELAFEDVLHHGPGQVLSAHAWGAAERAVLEVVDGINLRRMQAGEPPIVVHRVGVGQAKLALAGSGRAQKEDMVAAARARWPQVAVDWDAGDGDAADAAGVALAVYHPGETAANRQKREAAERRAKKSSPRP